MHLTRRRFASVCAASLLSPALPAAAAEAEAVVNVYSFRQPALVDPLFKRFTEETGITIKNLFADKGLIERIEQEGVLSPADVLLTADAGRLVQAKEAGLSQPLDSPVIRDAVPANLRDSGNEWFGLTMRARVVYASRARVTDSSISYEELADPKWKGKICSRPGNHPYNLGLVSAMIAHFGEDKARLWLQGLKANLAVKPSGNDREQAKGVFAGECDLAIANTYYMGLMETNSENPEQKEWAKSVRIIFPASPAMGTHVNISGMVLLKHAPHRDNAVKLMEFLASPEAQQLYASGNFEYPVNPAIKPSQLVSNWGSFTPDTLNIGDIVKHEKTALKLVEEVGFND